MKKEIKISLPLYKIVYAVFCADTYAQEIVSRRSEIQQLY